MGKQQPVRHYIDDTGARGKFSPTVREGQGSQYATEHAGFRARRNAMHEEDGHNDKDIEDRKGGDEPKTEGRPAMEEKEHPDEGTKEMSGKTHYREE